MGSYAECWLDDLYVGSSKNDVDPGLMALFRSDDRVVLTRSFQDVPRHLERYRDEFDQDADLKIIFYQTPIRVIRDRLNVLGYNLQTAEEAFQKWIHEERARVLDRIGVLVEGGSEESKKIREDVDDSFRNDAAILAAWNAHDWIESLKKIQELGLRTSYHGSYKGLYENTLIGYMLSNEWYGFPGYDFYVPLRLAIEACDINKSFTYDVTDLVWSGYFEDEDDFVQYTLDATAVEYSASAKTVVLTEGKTDAWILSESLKVLYPHLKDYYSFLDFESSKYGGGVGNLANIVKAFAGSGIVNNVVALFDNDTAAAAACKAMESLKLPENIVIKRLPRLPFLTDYPTIGPSGATTQDVNGIAASIELYLGEDVLRSDNGDLVPVQWTGYERLLNRYQGEVLDKPRLHARFREKVSQLRGEPGPEWNGLRAVLDTLFSAFAERNKKQICGRAEEHYKREKD